MAILGSKIEWRFATSIYPCSVKDCKEEVILIERWSGKRLCKEHANDDVLSNAEKNSLIDKNEYEIKDRSFYI